jgi:hypothetical protein
MMAIQVVIAMVLVFSAVFRRKMQAAHRSSTTTLNPAARL